MFLSLTVILSLVPPITAAAADEDTGIMTAGATTLEISADEAFLWESSADKKTLAGINPEWYKTNVTDAGVQCISIKIPASTETIRKDFGGVYATHEGYSTDGKKLAPVVPNCQQVVVDFSAATNLKTIGLQAFFAVSNLTGVIDLSNTQVEVIEGNAFKDTAITGVILPTTLKRVGNYDPGTTGSHAPVFMNCRNLEYIRVAGGSLTAVFELPSNLEVIGNSGFQLEGTKIEQTMKTNPFVITIPKSLKEMQHTAIGFDDRTAMQKAQYIFEETDFTNTKFQNDCLFALSYPNTWGVARFASKDAYDSFVAKYSGSSNFYGYPTYEFGLTFKDKETQTKLWGQSIQYEKNDTTNYWALNKNYTLPSAPTGQEPATGQVGYWELNSDELKADSKLPATPAETELTAMWTVVDKLAEPTIAYTLNGKVQGNLSDGVPVLLDVPYVNGKPGKIGVKAVHPLLKPEEGGSGTDDNYVYFKYRWIDVQSLQLGPRSRTIADGSGFYNKTKRTAPDAKYNEVEIRDSNDNRVKMSGTWGPYTFYNCEIYGYHVQNGVEKLFYASNALGSYSLGFGDDPGLTRTTNDAFYIQAKFLDVWTITFDLNGGTAPDGKYVPMQVPKNRGKGFTVDNGPVKEGYEFQGWMEEGGTTLYWPTRFYEATKDVKLVAQYDPIEYTINYVPNLADATGTVDAQEYTYDSADFKLTTDTFTNTTKDFLGWSLTPDATTADYVPGAAINDALKAAMVASADGTVTLYAVWKDKTTHTVTFNAGTNGSFANTSDPLIRQVVIEGLSVTGVPAVTANSRYRFDGWKLDGDTTGKVYTADEVKAMPVTADKTFTASYTYVWVPPVVNNKPATPAKPDMTDPKETGVADLLETTLHNAYMHGYGNGEFGPNRGMTRAEVAQMFYNLLRSKDVSITAHFVDVPEDAWFATAVNTLSSLGILDGIGNEMYDPDRVITRGEFAAIATRFAKANNNGNVSFEDVSAVDWFYNAVLTATNYGWIDGYEDNTFKPYSTITRAEVTTIVNRMLARRADKDFVADHIHNMRTFNDVDSSFWAYHYIMEATNGHDYDRVEHTEIWKSPTAQ